MHVSFLVFAFLCFLMVGKILLARIDVLYSDICRSELDVYHLVVDAIAGEPTRVCSSIISIRENIQFFIATGTVRALWMFLAILAGRPLLKRVGSASPGLFVGELTYRMPVRS